MKKITPFNPVNDKGQIVQKVNSVEQFEGFISWLSDKSDTQQALRKMSYQLHAPTLQGAERKQAFISTVCGDFLQHWLLKTNHDCLTLMESEGTLMFEDPQTNLSSDRVNAFKDLMDGFLQAVHSDVFEKTLIEAKLQPHQIRRLAKSLEEEKDLIVAMVSQLKKSEQEHWVENFERWRQSPTARAMVLASKEDNLISSAQSELMHAFEPLIEYICTNLTKVLRAELVGKFEMYVKSGHALSDLVIREDAQSSAPLKQLQTLFDAFSAGRNNVTPTELRDAIEERFQEIFISAKLDLSAHKGLGAIQSKHLNLTTSGTQPISLKKQAGSGYVDGMCLSKDRSELLLLMATSDEYMEKQDYWMSHFRAAQNLLEELKKEGKCTPDATLKFCISAPSLISDQNLRGASAGEQVLEYFQKPLHSHVQETFNTMPLISNILTVDKYLQFTDYWKHLHLAPFGASAAQFNAQMQLVKMAPTDQAPPLFLSALQKRLTEALTLFEEYSFSSGEDYISLSRGQAQKNKTFVIISTMHENIKKLTELPMLNSVASLTKNAWSANSAQQVLDSTKALNAKLNKFALYYLDPASPEYEITIQMGQKLQKQASTLRKYVKTLKPSAPLKP